MTLDEWNLIREFLFSQGMDQNKLIGLNKTGLGVLLPLAKEWKAEQEEVEPLSEEEQIQQEREEQAALQREHEEILFHSAGGIPRCLKSGKNGG